MDEIKSQEEAQVLRDINEKARELLDEEICNLNLKYIRHLSTEKLEEALLLVKELISLGFKHERIKW